MSTDDKRERYFAIEQALSVLPISPSRTKPKETTWLVFSGQAFRQFHNLMNSNHSSYRYTFVL